MKRIPAIPIMLKIAAMELYRKSKGVIKYPSKDKRLLAGSKMVQFIFVVDMRVEDMHVSRGRFERMTCLKSILFF